MVCACVLGGLCIKGGGAGRRFWLTSGYWPTYPVMEVKLPEVRGTWCVHVLKRCVLRVRVCEWWWWPAATGPRTQS